MPKEKQKELIKQTYRLALEGNRITVPYIQKELKVEDENAARAIIEVLVRYGKLIYVELEGERFWMPVNDLKPKLGMPDNPEKDEKLIELMSSAKEGEIPVYIAIVDIKKIKPFCEYKPKKESFEKTKEQLKKNIKDGKPPLLHLYQEGDHLIMSDDYYAYFMYLEEGFDRVPCIIFGETDIDGVQDKEKIDYS